MTAYFFNTKTFICFNRKKKPGFLLPALIFEINIINFNNYLTPDGVHRLVFLYCCLIIADLKNKNIKAKLSVD